MSKKFKTLRDNMSPERQADTCTRTKEMSELTPTEDNLNDPYVLQLIETLGKLQELTEADGKEIGSYRKGTGLRGENQALAKRIAELEAVNQSVAVCQKHIDDIVRGDCVICEIERLRAALQEIEKRTCNCSCDNIAREVLESE